MPTQVSIMNIKRKFKDVPTEDGDVRVYAISTRGLTSLMSLVPTVRKLMGGSLKLADLSVETLVEIAPDFVVGLIVAGADGDPDDKAYVEAAANLPIGVQADLLQGIVEVSMPKGVGPFMETISGVMGVLGGASGGKAPATK